jgi:hypothetical protein
MNTHFYKLSLRRLGPAYWLEAEPADGLLGPDHAYRHLRPSRFRTETEVLRAMEAAQIGAWTTFPYDGVYATLSPTQLRMLGFKGAF